VKASAFRRWPATEAYSLSENHPFDGWFLFAIAIKISAPKDPVFFVQQRTGKDGKRFAMYKFRTMVVHSDIYKKQLEQMNVLKWPDFKIPNDPRITRLGRILRKTSSVKSFL
jgi:lipopolysaccharide/colanic/teichoic acid biosynthesis glycosyltransferase